MTGQQQVDYQALVKDLKVKQGMLQQQHGVINL